MTEVLTLPGRGDGPEAARAAEVLEGGGLVLLPDLPFDVRPGERDLIDPAVLGGGSKNISLDPRTGALSGSALEGDRLEALAAMTRRYAEFADGLISRLAPGYAPHLKRKRTSFRPGAVATRALSPRKDDRRLHVDAFPASPVGSDRILRVFSNVDPLGRDRVWEVGEQGFEAFARDFAPRVRDGGGALRSLLALTGVTRGQRTAYDQAMLDLHDRAKLDEAWQAAAPRRRIAFPAGSSWIVYTDGVLHAALEGQHAFEQTYLMPLEAMEAPARSPQRTLERVLGRPLI
ncbi:MAG: Kdo hydroxylase family protein [Caulobacteraceae bacterium]|nr:Kdo hydroxylase family protein [Caulobacter sp.]